MGDNTTITQKAAIGSDTIQIGTQNNNYYNGLTPTQASQLAINLFMDNFPKLQEAAMKTVQERVNELIREIVRFLYKGIIIKHNKTEPTYTKTSLFLCEKRRFFMARTEKGVVTTI